MGSFILSPAHGWCGARATKNIIAPPPKKNWAKPLPAPRLRQAGKQAGKKEGSLGEGIFARLLSAPKARWGWKSVSAIPASAGRQNRKIFVSLIEKNLGGAQLKNVKKIFLFCSPRGERKRWAGFLSVRAEIVARKRFELRSVIATIRDIADFARSLFARSPRRRRGFARKFPHILGLNQTAGEARRGLVWKAGGGSFQFFLSAEGGIRSQFLFSALWAKGDFIKIKE